MKLRNILKATLVISFLLSGCINEPASFSSTSVVQKIVSSISLNVDNVKKTYYVGETLSLDGLIVTANYDDQTSSIVTSYTSNPAVGETFMSPSDAFPVSISYEGKIASFNVQVLKRNGKTNWTNEESSLMSQHLHGIVLPFLDIENASPIYDEAKDEIRISDIQVKDDQISEYASKFTVSDGWKNVTSDYSASSIAPEGSFYVFEKFVSIDGSKRGISVEFYGKNGSSYSKSGDFYLTAYDPFYYEYPSNEILSQFNELNLTSFNLPIPSGDDVYYEYNPDPNNKSYLDLGYFDQVYDYLLIHGLDETRFNQYVNLFANSGWIINKNEFNYYDANLIIEGVGVAKIMMAYTSYVTIRLYYVMDKVPTNSWPATQISEIFTNNHKTLYPFPAFSGVDARYSVSTYFYDDEPVAAQINIYKATASEINTFLTTTLVEDGWDVSGDASEGNAAKAFIDLDGLAPVMFSKNGNAFTILLVFDLGIIPTPYFPSEAITNAFVRLGLPAFTLTEPDGDGYTYEYRFNEDNLRYLNYQNLCLDDIRINNMNSTQFSNYITKIESDGWVGGLNQYGYYHYDKHFETEKLTAHIKLAFYSQENVAMLTIYYISDADPEEGWPTLTIAALLGHDITDVLPEYTGANSGFRLLNDYFGTAVQVMVEEGTEDAAIAIYEDILLANDYSKQGLYYYSKHQQIIVDVYCGTEGSITIDFRRNPHTDTFPLDDLNGFLTAYDFGFTLSEPLADPSGNGFEVTSGTDGGLHYYRIQVSGNRLSSYKSVLGPILTDAGYTLAQSTSNKVVYKNDDDRQIQIIYSSSSTYVSFYE